MSSCEAELQELMRQIDIMVHNRKTEWEADMERVKGQLRLREQEVASQRALLESKHQEVGRLRHQLDSSEGEKCFLASQYEEKLQQLRSQLSSLQRDYEKVERHHNKHTASAERDRNQASIQLQDTQNQLKTVQTTIQNYQKKANEWEIQKRAYRQQIESLETQRKTLADKCQLIQQQSEGYQDQLAKRRHLLEQTELNFQSQLTHLEGCLTRSQDTVEEKNATIQRLEERLEEMSGDRKAEEGEKLDSKERCRRLESHLKCLEDEKVQLKSELESRDNLIAEAERAMKQLKQNLAKMDESLALKEDMIRSLQEVSGQEALHQVNELQSQLEQAQRDNARWLRIETQLQEDIQRLQARLDESHLECARLNTELATKIEELRRLEGTEMKQLQDQLTKEKAWSSEQEQHYMSHLDGMKSEVTALTSDLHHRDSTIATLSQKIASLERKEREGAQTVERHQHELQITNAQLDALRIENRSLRENTNNPDTTSMSSEILNAQSQLQDLRNMHTQHMKTSQILQDENSMLRRKLTSLTQQLLEAESASDLQYQAAIKQSHLRIAELTQEYERKLEKMSEHESHNTEMLQSQLDTTVQQYEAEMTRLRDVCTALKQQLKDKTHLLNRLQGENSAMADFVSNIETIATSPPQPSSHVSSRPSLPALTHLSEHSSPQLPTHLLPVHSNHSTGTPHGRQPSPTVKKLFDDNYESAAVPEMLGFPELVIPSSKWESERPDSRQSITANFVAEDLRRTKDLEKLLDDHIASLEQQTEDTLQRRRIAGDGGDLNHQKADSNMT
ncbi:centrosomal protein of 63 kDa-like isoform X2 [Acanthaster planci]|nr:centrosomal protein of 63 kDa-like isoform X2 [Acanthaster planci]